MWRILDFTSSVQSMQVQPVLILLMKQDGRVRRAFYAKVSEPDHKLLARVKEAVPQHAGADEPSNLLPYRVLRHYFVLYSKVFCSTDDPAQLLDVCEISVNTLSKPADYQ